MKRGGGVLKELVSREKNTDKVALFTIKCKCDEEASKAVKSLWFFPPQCTTNTLQHPEALVLEITLLHLGVK